MRGDVALRGGSKGEGKRGEEGARVRRPRPQAPPPRQTRPLLRPALLAVAGRGHPRGRSPAQSAREDLIRLRALAARCFVAEWDGLQAVRSEGLFC